MADIPSETAGVPKEAIGNELRVGTDYLGVSIGFLTRIDSDTQEIITSTGDHPLLQPGERCPLGESYCQRTIETEGVLSVREAEAGDVIPTTAVETFGLETYVGAEITVDEELYGTICFADDDTRSEPFSETEELFVELLAERIGKELERLSYETALAKRNNRLEAEKRRFEGIAEASADVIFRIDENAEFTYLSPAAERLLGYDPETLVGKSFLDVVAAPSTGDALEWYRHVRGGDAVEGVEVALETVDGRVRAFEINARPFDDGLAGDDGVQGVARDVTDRKERRQELEVKNRAMDEAEVGIVIADATQEDNPVMYVNQKFCDLTGYDREAVIGTNCRFLQGDATDPASVAELGEALADAEPVSVDIVNYRASGYAFWNEVTITPVENDAGETVQYIGFQRDVTERKRRQQLLDVMNRVLRHNLRNKMNVVLGGVATAEGGGGMVETAAGDLISLADRAREIHATARTARNPERIDPDELFNTLRERFVGAHPEATVETTVETDRDLVAGSECRRAITELVTNALTHDPASDTTVTLAARDDGEDIVITVTDDGPGVDEMERAVVEAGSESPLEHGSGLGLWFVNWVVTRYGGSFQITPHDGDDGTTATVRLPAADSETDIESVARGPTTLAE